MVVGLQGGRRILGEDDHGISLFTRGDRLTQVQGDDVGNTGRSSRRKAAVLQRDDEEGEEEEGELDEGFESSESDDDADIEALQQAPERIGKTKKDSHVDGDVAFADSDSDLGSLTTESDQDLEEDDGGDLDEDIDEIDEDDDGALRWTQAALPHR
jgi:ribosome biogenesis protein BMS1